MDSVTEVVRRICRIPVEFHGGTKSMIELLEESGYRNAHNSIDQERIGRYLREHPDLVEEWLVYSCEKRTTGGWYFSEAGNGEFRVDRIEASASDSATGLRSSNPIEACAHFIRNELECLRNHME